MALDILIVDDEADIRDLVSGILSDEGYETRTAADSDQAISEIAARRPSLLILDIWLQNSKLDGLELLEYVRSRMPDLPVIVISGHGNVETAVAAIKRGAYDFIEKPFQSDHLLHTVTRATEAERLRRENDRLRESSGVIDQLQGDSNAITAVRQAIQKVAATNSRVMISGPAGSGKEVAARMLHAHSTRSAGPFCIVNAASMEPERVERELFGEEESGTGRVRPGYLEQAHRGTLLIDQIGDMPLPTQAKILRVLIEQSFTRIGGSDTVKVDVRIISSSSSDMRQRIEDGLFREDLYHRLNVVPINIPGLAKRRADVPQLAQHFNEMVSQSVGRHVRPLSEAALASLQAYDWPGNVRQLRNVIERMVIMASNDTQRIEADALPAEILNPIDSMQPAGNNIIMSVPLREAREAFEREYLRVQITRFSGNISRTASFVGMERSALHRKLKSLGLGGSGRDRLG